jgi:protein tyrosine/serine phosphatase
MGKIPPNTLYRSEHPISGNKELQDVAMSASEAQIKTIVNLCDNLESISLRAKYSPWYKEVLDKHNVAALNVNAKFEITEASFMEKMKQAIEFISKHDPPYLIHCAAGIDRAGFLSFLLEAYMFSSLDEMAKDYMLSFTNIEDYSQIERKSGRSFILNLFSIMKGELVNTNDDLQYLSAQYLLEKVGLSAVTLAFLEEKLLRQ